MVWLMLASIIWAFSFGILKNLTLSTDPFFVNLIRTAVATMFFMLWQFISQLITAQKNPEISRQVNWQSTQLNYWRAFICGAIQIGLMYGPYTLSFRFIKAYEVALFTMTTPIIMAIFFVPSAIRRAGPTKYKLGIRLITAILLATAGGIIATYQGAHSDGLLIGAGLVQISNGFFVLGSVLWKTWFTAHKESHHSLMPPFFAGAFVMSSILCALFAASFDFPNALELYQMIWLGAVSSGLGFYLWNKGAIAVSGMILSVANNLKIPTAILVSIVFFGEKTTVGPLVLGVLLIAVALQMSSDHRETKVPR